jgi:integrase
MGKKSLSYQGKMALEAVDKAAQRKNEDNKMYSGTKDQYMRDITKYTAFCKREYGIKNFEKCKNVEYIQHYSDCLSEDGYSANTVHTYVAAVCKATGIKMGKIELPIRHSAENTRSRRKTKTDARKSARAAASARLHAFAEVVGIRRNEYKNLRGADFMKDESGYWCVVVRKGKGGKFHMQRVPLDKVEFVRSYFTCVGPKEYVFTKKEMQNDIDLHALRAARAKERYYYYVNMFATDRTARRRVFNEICARWKQYNGNPLPKWEEVNVPYYLRGMNKAKAIAEGREYKLDRLALLAVSVFHLSHWRVDTTVSNYMMA